MAAFVQPGPVHPEAIYLHRIPNDTFFQTSLSAPEPTRTTSVSSKVNPAKATTGVSSWFFSSSGTTNKPGPALFAAKNKSHSNDEEDFSDTESDGMASKGGLSTHHPPGDRHAVADGPPLRAVQHDQHGLSGTVLHHPGRLPHPHDRQGDAHADSENFQRPGFRYSGPGGFHLVPRAAVLVERIKVNAYRASEKSWVLQKVKTYTIKNDCNCRYEGEV